MAATDAGDVAKVPALEIGDVVLVSGTRDPWEVVGRYREDDLDLVWLRWAHGWGFETVDVRRCERICTIEEYRDHVRK